MQFENIKRYKSWLISVGIVAVVAVWLASGQVDGNNGEEPAATPAKRDTRSAVRVHTQSAEEVMRTITVNGNTAPSRVAHLAAETDGRVEYIGAERGASLDHGDVIVRLDKRDRMARLAQAEAVLKQREVEYEARLKLKSESYVSESQLQEAVALLEAAKAELKRAELDLEYMTVRAPFAGALQARNVEVGDFVSRGDPVATFVDNRKIVVSANLSEFDARYVNVGEDADAMLATGEKVRGKIRYVAPVADAATRTFLVELEVDNTAGSLRAGGTAELRIPAERVSAHRISPSLLTLDDAGNIGVKIVNDESQVEFVNADIALSSSDGMWLTGLPDIATIITVGQGYVVAGSFVDAVHDDDAKTAIAIKADDGDADQ